MVGLNHFLYIRAIRALNGNDIIGDFDILCGGFPCQAFSHAARGANIAEKNLWLEMFRVVQEAMVNMNCCQIQKMAINLELYQVKSMLLWVIIGQ